MPYEPFRNPYLEALDFGSPRREAAFPALPDEEADSLLGKIGGLGLSGLGWVGEAISKPFRAVYGTASGLTGGEWGGGLLNLIPFSDTMGITDPQKSIAASDLAERFGIIPKNEPGFDPWDVVRFGVDVVGDPLTYATFGASAIGKGGQIAKAINKLPATSLLRRTTSLDDILKAAPALREAAETAATAKGLSLTPELLGEKLGGRFGIGLPFANPVKTFNPPLLDYLGSTRVGQLIGNAKDATGRLLAPIFEKGVMGETAEIGQDFGRELARRIEESVPKVRERWLEGAMQPGAVDAGQELRRVMELGAPAEAGVQKAADLFTDINSQRLARIQELGGSTKELEDISGIGYAPRGKTPLGTEPYRQGPAFVRDYERLQQLKNIPGGTLELEKNLVADPRLTGGLAKPMTAEARKQWLKNATDILRGEKFGLNKSEIDLTESALERARLDLRMTHPTWNNKKIESELIKNITAGEGPIAKDVYANFVRWKQAPSLAKTLGSLEPERVTKGLFANAPLMDQLQYMERSERLLQHMDLSHDTLAKLAVHADEAPPNAVRLLDTMKSANLANQYKRGEEIVGGRSTILARLQKGGILPADATIKDLKNLYIPKEVADTVTRTMKYIDSPDELKPFVKLWDQLTNLTKAGQVAFFPLNAATYFRNRVSDFFRKWTTGAHYPGTGGELNPLNYLQPMKDAAILRNGGVLESANKFPGLTHLTAEEASRQLQKEFFAHDVAGRAAKETSDILGAVPKHPGGLPPLPGQPQPGIGSILKGSVPRSWQEVNPLNIAGVRGTDDLFTPVKTGRALESHADDINRYGTYLAKRMQGYSPAAAAREVKVTHYDFGNLTPVERNVFRRAIPYYSWLKNNTPAIIGELLTKPGGKSAQYIKLAAALRSEGYVPEYLGGGLAAPIGGEKEGTQRYLTKIDTPIESAFEPLRGTFGGTAMAMLGQLNPLIKAPLESIVGKQFYSGRNMGDLESRIGRTLGVTPGGIPGIVDQVLMNSPLIRPITVAGTLADERKGLGTKALNLLTGAKVTDVDMQKARDIETRKMLQEELKQPGSPVKEFSSLYVPKAAAGQLSPDQVQKMRLLRNLEARAKEAALRKRAEAGDKEAQRELLKMAMKGR